VGAGTLFDRPDSPLSRYQLHLSQERALRDEALIRLLHIDAREEQPRWQFYDD
jgi:hypothetical protein